MEPNIESAGEPIATLQLPPLASTPIPDQADGVNAIVKLTREASQVAIVDISTKGLCEGLPDKVPLVIGPTARADIAGKGFANAP